MCFKRSTRKIVTGKRSRTQDISPAEDTNAVDPIYEGHAVPQETPAGKNLSWWTKSTAAMRGFVSNPAFIIIAAIAALILVITVIVTFQTEPTLPAVTSNQVIVSVPSDAALTGYIVPGDIVRIYGTDGQPVPELQYVEVFKSTANGRLLLLADDLQAAALASLETGPRIALLVHQDPARAAELLELQAGINDPTIVLVVQNTAEACPGESLELQHSLSIEPIEAAPPAIEWTSSDAAVATVKDGIVTTHGVGTAEITAVCGDVQASCSLTVKVGLTRIQLDNTQAELAVEEDLQLTATPDPEDTTDFDVTWYVDDPSIATVSQFGEITGISPGSTTVTVSCGDITAKCAITVGYHAEVVQLDKNVLQLTAGRTDKLTPTIYPSANVIDVSSFESSNSAVVTVDEDGIVKAVAPGTATITFRCGEATATCTVVVITLD